MPNEASHLSLANHNQDLLDKLVAEIDAFPDWAATVAFYKALHVVEAVFACENPARHGADHPTRERVLKSDKKYEHIYRNYRVLYAASMVARYMQDDRTNFSDYLTPQRVVDELLKHRLHEVEKSAAKRMRSPDRLTTIASRLPSPPPASPTAGSSAAT
ncbi:MAG: hypothetical protein P4L85_09940 [Paludisphaera borealis]|uniref:hypothetical protein n=1 Tax=Paludisphaera borealis TaxID=1387353 RepID=UPI00283F22E6|nr:hypothetical protein [Paludisphaera borealis]MDR3619660.1 hypothetical protein [Paludisphaera borealis]